MNEIDRIVELRLSSLSRLAWLKRNQTELAKDIDTEQSICGLTFRQWYEPIEDEL